MRLGGRCALVVALAFACASACGGRAGGTSGGGSDGGTDGSAGCSGGVRDCADGCGSDYFPERAECVGGEWRCPQGTVLPEECPSGTCWGAPLPGETCDEGWACEPDASAWQECPSLMCATCRNFDGPQQVGDCVCECNGVGNVQCINLDDPVPPPTQPPCEGLDFCACHQRSDCTYETDSCLCPCDYECPGEPPCDCACGGGAYLGCRSVNQ